MEVDGNGICDSDGENLTVSGNVFHFNKGAAFFRFKTSHDESQICLFRPNKLYIDGAKPGASNFKSVATIGNILRIGDEIHGTVVAHNDTKPYVIEGYDDPITPNWYAVHVWKGVKPVEIDTMVKNSEETIAKAEQQETVIDDIQGKIIHNKMAINAKGGANQTFISFTNPDGKQDLAMFRNQKYFYVDGERAKPEMIKMWPVNQELDVMFSAIYTPSLKEYVHIEGEQGGTPSGDQMNVETRYKPNWRARVVWIGEKPSEELISRDSADRMSHIKNKKDKSEFLETIKDCDYLCARLEKIVNNNQGILMLKSRGILFDIENLSIDGSTFSKEDNLNQHLEVGENLFAYVKTIKPRIVDGYEVSSEAAQIWKGKRSQLNSDKNDKKKTPIPLPSEASHQSMCGTVVDIQSGGLGYLELEMEEGVKEKVLFSRNRLFVDGQRLRFKDCLSNYVNIGDKLFFDMVRADPEEAEGEYKWLAVLTWKGHKPDSDEINEISKKIENYRAKILMFDDWIPEQGYVSGILQVMGGSSKIGERALFNRQNVYVFGAWMGQADLAYVVKLNDKVQLELEELDTVILKFGVEIKYRASLVWVGSPPKLDENCADFPHYVGNIIMPFITKRGFSVEDFTKLIKGEMPPKAKEESSSYMTTTSNINASTTSASVPSNASLVKKPSLVLPPNTIYGRVIELKKADSSSMTGTEHGIFQIENGPWEGEKAFFNRNCLFCWGHNCAKADLMYLIKDGDKFCVEVADGTNNKSVPFKVTSAWIGPHPHEKNKESAAMAGNPHFMKWCKDHGLSIDLFRQVIAGEAHIRPFFPLCSDQHQARVAYLFPQSSSKTGSDGGVLRLFAGYPNSKEGRKAPEVLFERDSVYIWNVAIANGDLNYVLQENDKVFVEVVDLLGKEKKKWQNRLGSTQVPKFIATLVFIGGGRPKVEKISEDFTKNSNLVQWLNKRNMDIEQFNKIISGRVPPKSLDSGNEDMFSQDYPNISGSYSGNNGNKSGSGSPFSNPVCHSLAIRGGNTWQGMALSNSGNGRRSEFANPIMRQAEMLTQRTMMLQSPEDPEVTNLIQDDGEAQLALFLSKTLTNAIMMYRQGGPSGAGPIGPPSHNKPGPIGPPRERGKVGNGRGGRGHADFTEFYADSSLGARGGGSGGLYGLSEPLLQYHGGHNHGPGQPPGMEPPYKRKYEDW